METLLTFLDPPAQPTTVPREAGNPFNAAFDLERGFQGRFQSKEAFEEYQRECLAQRNGQDKAQVDLVKYLGCLDDLPVT